jgi:hypothetical protein
MSAWRRLIASALAAQPLGCATAQDHRAAQRTLTIVIKFDEDQRVRDFAYRSSSF